MGEVRISDRSTSKRPPDILMNLQGIDFGYAVEVNRMAHMLVRRWGDYAPTEAAFRGDECLRRGHTEGQRFWIDVIFASGDILNVTEVGGAMRTEVAPFRG